MGGSVSSVSSRADSSAISITRLELITSVLLFCIGVTLWHVSDVLSGYLLAGRAPEKEEFTNADPLRRKELLLKTTQAEIDAIRAKLVEQRLAADSSKLTLDARVASLDQSTAILVAITPHMHFRGKDARYELLHVDGRREILLAVPHYSFDWQLQYRFKIPVLMEKGSRMEVTFHYDNSINNQLGNRRSGCPSLFILHEISRSLCRFVPTTQSLDCRLLNEEFPCRVKGDFFIKFCLVVAMTLRPTKFPVSWGTPATYPVHDNCERTPDQRSTNPSRIAQIIKKIQTATTGRDNKIPRCVDGGAARLSVLTSDSHRNGSGAGGILASSTDSTAGDASHG
jgi:hypothetical protein